MPMGGKMKKISIVVCLLAVLFLVNNAYAVQYEVIDLGTLGGSLNRQHAYGGGPSLIL